MMAFAAVVFGGEMSQSALAKFLVAEVNADDDDLLGLVPPSVRSASIRPPHHFQSMNSPPCTYECRIEDPATGSIFS